MELRDQSIRGVSYNTIHKAAIESSKDAILICDNEGYVLDHNTGFLKLWNLKQDDLESLEPNQWIEKVNHQLDSPGAIGKFVEREVSQDLQSVHKLQNGKFVEVDSRPLVIEGETKGQIWYFNDITERELAKQELEKQGEIMRAVFEQSLDGMLVVDKDQKVLDFNQVYLDLFKLDPEFLIDEAPDKVIEYSLQQLRQTEKYRKEIYALIRNPNMQHSSIIEFKNGKIVERFTEILKIRNEVAGRVLFYRDISEATEQINKLMERTYELDSFIYSASHDLKAPLNSIMGLLDIVKGEELSDKARQFVELMDTPVDKLNFYILNLAKLAQNQKYDVQNQGVDFEEMIQESLSVYQYIPGMDKIQVDHQVSGNRGFFSDPVRIKVILQNILSNAIKFKDDTKDQCRISIKVDLSDKESIVKIKDNGIGIASKHLSKIFNLFYRASAHAPGSGLGLYVVLQTLNKIGGSVECDSIPGSWTEFSIKIPNMAKG